MTAGTNELERLEMALSFGMDPETAAPLSDAKRADIEAKIAMLKGGDNEPQSAATQEAGAIDPQALPGATDLQALIAAEVAKAFGGAGVTGGQPANMSFEDILDRVDPRDSDAALAMLTWLEKNGRLQNIGSIHGGGYLWHYAEPKGTTKEGYTPGATKGGRMVDEAVKKAEASGAKPRKVGVCDRCFSAVEQQEDGTVSLDGDPTNVTCNDGQPHGFMG